MGFYVRKSLRAGPFRYNLSKSGIGVSVGVPGFRVGSGPRGNYIRAGRGGVYYRATLGGKRKPRSTSPAARRAPVQEPIGATVPMEDISGASAAELVPTGADDLVQQLNDAGSRIHMAWMALLAAIVLAVLVQGTAAIVLLVLAIPLIVWLELRDRARRSVVTFYEVEDQHAQWFTELVAAVEALAQASNAWRVTASGRVQNTYQYKVNSGANQIVNRAAARASLNGPKRLVANIAVPSIESGRHGLHFLPDRLLVRDGKRFSDLSYAALNIDFDKKRFIEDGKIPKDGQQVDTTWRFVNVKGGPDRRYNNNRQLPVMLYGEVEFSSQSGLHWLLQCSRVSAAEGVSDALKAAPASTAAPT